VLVSIVDFIEKLQKKPRHVRVQILWLAIFISMAIIVSLWLVSFRYSLNKMAQSPALPEEASGSLKEIKRQIPQIQENLGAAFKNLFEENQATSSPFE